MQHVEFNELSTLNSMTVSSKKEYVSKIEMLGIDEVMIEENVGSLKKVLIMREDVKSSFREKVKSVIERHVYSDNKELKELTETADSIITNILDNDEVVEETLDDATLELITTTSFLTSSSNKYKHLAFFIELSS